MNRADGNPNCPNCTNSPLPTGWHWLAGTGPWPVPTVAGNHSLCGGSTSSTGKPVTKLWPSCYPSEYKKIKNIYKYIWILPTKRSNTLTDSTYSGQKKRNLTVLQIFLCMLKDFYFMFHQVLTGANLWEITPPLTPGSPFQWPPWNRLMVNGLPQPGLTPTRYYAVVTAQRKGKVPKTLQSPSSRNWAQENNGQSEQIYQICI